MSAATKHWPGEAVGLPHHISSVDETAVTLNKIQTFLDAIGSPPQLVTIATSRTDKYLPDAQANRIHMAICQLLAANYTEEDMDAFVTDTSGQSVSPVYYRANI